jgi:hypothetical protein
MTTEKKIALVTAGNRGLGFETCRQLAQLGLTVSYQSVIGFPDISIKFDPICAKIFLMIPCKNGIYDYRIMNYTTQSSPTGIHIQIVLPSQVISSKRTSERRLSSM